MLWTDIVLGLKKNYHDGEILYEPKKYVQRKPNKKVFGAFVNKLQNIEKISKNKLNYKNVQTSMFRQNKV